LSDINNSEQKLAELRVTVETLQTSLEEAQHRLATLQVVHEVAQSLTSELNLEPLLHEIVSSAVLNDTGEDKNVKKLKAKFKLWLSTRDIEGVFGDGKWRLLKAIESTGSLVEASESLKISYRKAWGDLKKAQKALNKPLVEKHRGGIRGGQSTLTEQGKQWVKAYTSFRNDIEKAIEQAYQKHITELL
jgi:molybdate transport system regulatory protein